MLADAPILYQSLLGIQRHRDRTSAMEQADRGSEGPVVADFCRSALSIAAIPSETAEFNVVGLAGDRERAMSVESGCGAVAVDSVCLLPPLSSGGAQVTWP